MKASVLAFLVLLTVFLAPRSGMCAEQDSKLVTRIETVTVHFRGGKLTIQATGMAPAPSFFSLGLRGHLAPRKGSHELDKNGFLEYDFSYKSSGDNKGSRLRPVKASFKESSVPPGVKGVEVFAEFNEAARLVGEPKKKKKKSENPEL